VVSARGGPVRAVCPIVVRLVAPRRLAAPTRGASRPPVLPTSTARQTSSVVRWPAARVRTSATPSLRAAPRAPSRSRMAFATRDIVSPPRSVSPP